MLLVLPMLHLEPKVQDAVSMEKLWGRVETLPS